MYIYTCVYIYIYMYSGPSPIPSMTPCPRPRGRPQAPRWRQWPIAVRTPHPQGPADGPTPYGDGCGGP